MRKKGMNELKISRYKKKIAHSIVTNCYVKWEKDKWYNNRGEVCTAQLDRLRKDN